MVVSHGNTHLRLNVFVCVKLCVCIVELWSVFYHITTERDYYFWSELNNSLFLLVTLDGLHGNSGFVQRDRFLRLRSGRGRLDLIRSDYSESISCEL